MSQKKKKIMTNLRKEERPLEEKKGEFSGRKDMDYNGKM